MSLRKVFDRLQLDRTLSYALATRIWQAVSGPITIWLVMESLNKDETGVFYALIGVINIQAMFELGLLSVLIAHAGHAASAIDEAQQKSVDDDDVASVTETSFARMAELIHASRVWFSGASILFAVAALAIGWLTFDSSDTQAQWRGPLLALIPIVALTVYISPSLAILEGSGKRELIYRFAFYARFMGTFTVWATLLMGYGIWALVVSALVQLLWTAYLPCVHQQSFFKQYNYQRFKAAIVRSSDFSWMKDVVPAQWRVALISVAYQFAVQYFAVILFYFHGSVEAGRLGMTLQITVAIQMLAMTWVQTKFSVVSAKHGQGDREEAGTLWRQTALISTSLLVVAFATLCTILYFLPHIESAITSAGFRKRALVDRFITPTQCVFLGIACVANHLQALQGFYVLARRANPLVVASVVGSLIIAASVWIGGAYFATDGIVIGYALSITLFALPIHTIAYMKFRRQQPKLITV